MIRESKRRNAAYRQHAFLDLGLFAELRDDIDMYSEVSDIVAPVIENLLSSDTEMDLGSSSTNSSPETAWVSLRCGPQIILADCCSQP